MEQLIKAVRGVSMAAWRINKHLVKKRVTIANTNRGVAPPVKAPQNVTSCAPAPVFHSPQSPLNRDAILLKRRSQDRR